MILLQLLPALLFFLFIYFFCSLRTWPLLLSRKKEGEEKGKKKPILTLYALLVA
jgi:hypothetical protein